MKTANIVIASAALLIANLHFCLNKSNTAEIKVPAWPIPTHQTKLVISHAQPTVLFRPQDPTPVPKRYTIHPIPQRAITMEIINKIYQVLGGLASIGRIISSVMSL